MRPVAAWHSVARGWSKRCQARDGLWCRSRSRRGLNSSLLSILSILLSDIISSFEGGFDGATDARLCPCQVFAMKSMLKNHMILKNQVTHVKAERDVMAEADDPWIVKLMYSFQVSPSIALGGVPSFFRFVWFGDGSGADPFPPVTSGAVRFQSLG